MGTRKPEDIRAVVVVGHGGSGKTTLTEVALFDAGVTTRMGKIEDGNTVSDFSSEEQKRQISINASVATLPYKGKTLYLLDAPGYADFIGDMRSSMRVADAAVMVVSGVHGVEVQTEKAWEFSEDFNIPVVFFLSKMARENADFERSLGEIRQYMTERAMPLFLPIGKETTFKGVADLLSGKAYLYKGDGSKDMSEGPIPADMADAVAAARESLVECIVEADDELMMRYLDGEQISMEELVPALRKSVRERRLFPVIPGDSGANVGIYQFLDIVADVLPSPLEMAPRPALKGDEEVQVAPDPKGPFMALCFKVMVDPYVGKLSFLRVFSGTLTSDQPIYNVNKGEEERVSAFKLMCGKEGKDTKDIVVGDILAIPKLHSTVVGDTLAVKGCSLTFPPIQFPLPVYSVAVLPKSRADEDKLATSLHRMLEEDATLSYKKDPETNDNILSGMGDLHLDIMLSRIKERYGVELETRTPRVPYRETIKKKAKAQGKYKKQTGGRGQYGDAHIEFEPMERGTGFEFLDKVVGGVVPKSYIPAVEKGLREALPKGYLAGYPMVDIRASLVFGSYHDVDSSEMAFKIAASLAFKEAMKSASPVLLEPIMNVEVVVPEEYLGDVMGDMNSRRGRIMGIDSKGRLQVVKAQVPMGEMFRYAIVLRSMTSGRGNFTMAFSHYEEAPAEVTKKVVAEYQAQAEEEKD
ncbi:elongation factor G [Aminiphilus circumscriptus]|jgi:elongation factor G|uniref:elongation factor G n=1 Tax=Aminiphilus circumscriptus TaxID=290732 RepID=UPI000492A495|nr:elongation factor G [Aminiphilus circumscriptus]